MQANVAAAYQIGLCEQRQHPREAEQAMDDELRIAIAGLPDVPEPIVGEAPQRQSKNECAGEGEVVPAHPPICRHARLQATRLHIGTQLSFRPMPSSSRGADHPDGPRAITAPARWPAAHSTGGRRLHLPETVIIAALKIDGEPAMPRNFHNRNGDPAASFDRSGKGCVNIRNEPIRPHYRIFVRAQRRTNPHQPAACQRRGARPTESSVRCSKLHIERRGISGAGGVDVHGYDFEVLDLHGFSSGCRPSLDRVRHRV
jgi:hypothetical protein